MNKEFIKKIDDQNFAKTIESGLVLVDFFADWCGPCRMMHPILEELAQEMSGKLTVVQVDVDASKKTTEKFQISSIPTLILFKDGEVVTQVVGLKNLDTLKKIVSSSV